MKATDLKIPCSWEERRPCLLEKLLYIPEYFLFHKKYADIFSLKQIFPNKNPISIEFCSGNGDWIIEKAKKNPLINWIAVEKRFDRARKIWAKIHNNNLSNLFVIMGEALTFSTEYLPESSVSNIYINFPDPWPKKKHIKHRLVKEDFIKELSRISLSKTNLIFATDDQESANRVCELLLESPLWSPFSPHPYYVNKLSDYGTSFFDSLWRKKGKEIYYLEFVNEKKKSG
jgi:tRNA (guanine-N7-)-methyltransferase